MSSFPNLAQFYSQRNVFITGVTGFLGKMLLARLLTLFPDIGTIYVLMRPKKSQNPESRLRELLDSRLFAALKSQIGPKKLQAKIVVLAGDIEEPRLGLSTASWNSLVSDVEVIFHAAATVRFDEPLSKAIRLNLCAVRDMLELASECVQLRSFVHVSTAYMACEENIIGERVYEPPYDPMRLIQLCEWLGEDLDSMDSIFLRKKPNTYVLTKHCAENLIVETVKWPTAIVRPAIIGAAWKDPLPGWIDNYMGLSGVYVAYGKGLMRSLICDRKKNAGIIPVDVVANQLIAVGWYTAVKNSTEVAFYNCCPHSENTVTWGDTEKYITETFKEIPLENVYRRPDVKVRSSLTSYYFWTTFQHKIPAFLYDVAMTVAGRTPVMKRIYKRIDSMVITQNFFSSNEWIWPQKNFTEVSDAMRLPEKLNFSTDTGEMDWPDYMRNFALGIKKYLLNEKDENIPRARSRLLKLAAGRYILNFFMICIVSYFVLLWSGADLLLSIQLLAH